jgi:hypothetical protein
MLLSGSMKKNVENVILLVEDDENEVIFMQIALERGGGQDRSTAVHQPNHFRERDDDLRRITKHRQL